MKKLLFVFNPHSGTGKIGKSIADVLDVFTKAGYETVAYPTQSAGDGKEKILRDGMSYDRIVAAGGDGMLHELVNAVMRLPEKVPAGYLPVGTVNDFAKTNGIPGDPAEAAKIAVSDNLCSLDVGCFGDEFFAYVAAFGFAANVSYSTNQDAKNRFGKVAYLAEILKNMTLPQFEAACKEMTIAAGDNVISGKFAFGAISNSNFIAGMNNIVSEDASLDDGVFEGLFVRKPTSLTELQLMQKGLVEKDLTAPCLCPLTAEKFEIISEPAEWTLDGENGGTHEKISVSVRNKAFLIALP